MIMGMTPFTFFHVVLSLIGIGTGFVVLLGLLTVKPLNGWTATFLVTTVLTSVTGFLFPFEKLLPSHILGVLSLIALTLAILARYRFQLAGGWRRTYVISAMSAQYFNVFVLVVQLFSRVPALKVLAPTQSEGPFKLAQLAVLIFFIVVTALAASKFRSAQLRTA